MEDINCMQDKNLEINNLLDGNGFVKVIKVSPETHPPGYNAEYLVAKAARASYNKDNRSPAADKGLIEYLVRNYHTSPLEMCSITFCMKMPVAICRQLLRHRTGKFNEFSQRYTEVTEEVSRFKLSETVTSLRGQCKINHQGSDFNLDINQAEKITKKLSELEKMQDKVFQGYQDLISYGYAKELARFYLPLSTYTVIYVQFDLNNLMKFFRLRCAEDAQYEIRVYANAMKLLARQFFPICLDIHSNYDTGMHLGKIEMEVIKTRKIPESVVSKSHIKRLRTLAESLNIKLTN